MCDSLSSRGSHIYVSKLLYLSGGRYNGRTNEEHGLNNPLGRRFAARTISRYEHIYTTPHSGVAPLCTINSIASAVCVTYVTQQRFFFAVIRPCGRCCHRQFFVVPFLPLKSQMSTGVISRPVLCWPVLSCPIATSLSHSDRRRRWAPLPRFCILYLMCHQTKHNSVRSGGPSPKRSTNRSENMYRTRYGVAVAWKELVQREMLSSNCVG